LLLLKWIEKLYKEHVEVILSFQSGNDFLQHFLMAFSSQPVLLPQELGFSSAVGTTQSSSEPSLKKQKPKQPKKPASQKPKPKPKTKPSSKPVAAKRLPWK
jgi:hypothetical protein